MASDDLNMQLLDMKDSDDLKMQLWDMFNANGQHCAYETPEKLQSACSDYFEWAIDQPMYYPCINNS